ncbi:MAG: V-type ATP synthase subunit E [Thermodesulfovibrionales bacterium]|jgi:vacuolar-type H+-ATPase subunit E/Vma4
MGCKELIESLRKEADKRIESIWQDAGAEAEKIRTEASRKIELIREESTKACSSEVRDILTYALSEADKQARMCKLSAEKNLSDRLFSVATSCLGRLRNERYKDVFKAIAGELPPCSWQTVSVNPEDVDIAREIFPDAEIIQDTGITGGLAAAAEDGKIRIINTFEARLIRAWEDLLPELIKDVYQQETDNGAPGEF